MATVPYILEYNSNHGSRLKRPKNFVKSFYNGNFCHLLIDDILISDDPMKMLLVYGYFTFQVSNMTYNYRLTKVKK